MIAFATTAAESDAAPTPDDATGPATLDAEAAEPVTVDARVWIRDRSAETTLPVAELGSGAPAISGDGCLVAYVVTDDAPEPAATLTTVDRCSAESATPLPIGAVVDAVPVAERVTGAPAVSFDGSTIVWSTGLEIRRYVRDESMPVHRFVDAFDTDLAPSARVLTGERVGVSADGRTVVYVAGPGAGAPEVGNVYVWSQPDEGPATIELLSATADGRPGAAASGSPTISGDGALVAFESVSTDLVPPDGATTSDADGDTMIEPDGTTASDPDGDAAPDSDGDASTDSDGDAAPDPFVVVVDRSTANATVVVDDARSPTLSADGTRLVHQRGEALRVLRIGDDGAMDEEQLLSDIVSDGPAAISQHGRWVAWAGTAQLPGEGTDREVGVWTADLRPADDPIDTTTTSTIAPAPTTTVGPVGPPAVPPTTASPRPVLPRFPTVGRSTSSSSTRVIGSGAAPLDATATPVRFDPTIVGAGRRTATVTLTAGRSTTVTSVELAAGPFAVAGDGCTGLSLSTSATCSVEVDFRPVTVGPVSGLLTFRLGDGSVTSARLDGEGSPSPTLDLVPAVATPGQVVTVFGAGFPAGAIVDLRHGVERDDVTVDDAGTFAHAFVVMTRTPAGPMELVVVGQVDRFADVPGELLVSSRSLGTGSPAFRDGIVSGLGR